MVGGDKDYRVGSCGGISSRERVLLPVPKGLFCFISDDKCQLSGK